MLRSHRRVVITGIGLVTPLGCGVTDNWEALVNGRSGIGPVKKFDPSELPVRFAGEVQGFEPERYIEKREIKKIDPFTQYALGAAHMAMEDTGFQVSPEEADRVGVVLGVGMGGIATIEDYHRSFLESGYKKLSPFFIPRLIVNMAPGQIAIRFGCRGINYVTASACASGGHAVGEAFHLIRRGHQDAMVTGGSEAAVTPMSIAGFAVMRALSTRNDEPQRASRPFDRGRDGFVIGEGAGILLIESLEHAQARGARIYAEIIGYGANSDAYHITSPAPEGVGAAKCMQLALDDAEIDASEVDYVNAHGTSTPYNDANETQAIKTVFGAHAPRLAVSSTKSMTGHLLGGAGGVEVAYTAMAIERGMLPPTINYDEPDPECDLDYVPNRARAAHVRAALSNSFGFGGANSCIVMRRFEG